MQVGEHETTQIKTVICTPNQFEPNHTVHRHTQFCSEPDRQSTSVA